MGVLRVMWDPENSGCTDGGQKLKKRLQLENCACTPALSRSTVGYI